MKSVDDISGKVLDIATLRNARNVDIEHFKKMNPNYRSRLVAEEINTDSKMIRSKG